MWNDTEIPLAYLITFRTYGTWLHGDERGSVDRFRNTYKTSYIKPDKTWKKYNKQTLKHEPVTLDALQRGAVEEAIRETCCIRVWELKAINVRTNHAHSVVTIGEVPPDRALNAFKANATRKMKEAGCWRNAHSPWVDGGSKRYLWNEPSVGFAIDYVLYGQGDELPDFDF